MTNNLQIGFTKKVEIAIFDLDGTLVDTDGANSAAYRCALSSMGRYISPSVHRRIFSSVVRSSFKDMEQAEMVEIGRLKCNAYVNELWRTSLASAFKPLMEAWRNRSHFKKLVLLTDSKERRAYETLRYWSLDGCFDEIVCNGGNGDKYANYFKVYDSDPAACVVWENENRQINAAIAAGVRKENIRKVA
jgi:beta-phosphoglucomutase-like phosphatase (HAD superfamily)